MKSSQSLNQVKINIFGPLLTFVILKVTWYLLITGNCHLAEKNLSFSHCVLPYICGVDPTLWTHLSLAGECFNVASFYLQTFHQGSLQKNAIFGLWDTHTNPPITWYSEPFFWSWHFWVSPHSHKKLNSGWLLSHSHYWDRVQNLTTSRFPLRISLIDS